MVSHDVEFCAQYADSVSMFFDGGVVTTNTPALFFRRTALYNGGEPHEPPYFQKCGDERGRDRAMPDQQTKLKRCGTYTWFGFTLPFERKLALIAEAGFQTICTWWTIRLPERTGARRSISGSRSGRAFPRAHASSLFRVRPLWFPGEEGRRAVRALCTERGAGGGRGIKTAVLHPFGKYVPENGNWSIYLSRMRRIAEQCEQSGIRLAVENLRTTKRCARIVDALADSPRGRLLRYGHNHVTAGNDFSLLSRFPDRIFALHVHDNSGLRDEHLLPYEGTVDWAAFLAAAERTEFGGSLMLEACWPVDWDKLNEPDYEYEEPPIPPEEYLCAGKEKLRADIGERTED